MYNLTISDNGNSIVGLIRCSYNYLLCDMCYIFVIHLEDFILNINLVFGTISYSKIKSLRKTVKGRASTKLFLHIDE